MQELLQLLAAAKVHACAASVDGASVAPVLRWAAEHQQQHQRRQQQQHGQQQRHGVSATTGTEEGPAPSRQPEQPPAAPADGAGASLGVGGHPGGSSGSIALDADTVSRQYRRLALLLHPDKWGAAGRPEGLRDVASAAFRLLREGCQQLLPAPAPRQQRPPGRKRPRQASARDDYDGNDSSSGSGGSDGLRAPPSSGEWQLGDDDPDAWWQQWVFEGAAAVTRPTTCPSAGDEEPQLWAMQLQVGRGGAGRGAAAGVAPGPGAWWGAKKKNGTRCPAYSV